MIPDAILSCGFLLLGSGTCIYRLINHSYSQFSKIVPQFIFASIGITAIGIRSIFGLTYNLFWRHYPIDPILIEQELLNKNEDKYFTDWSLYNIGLSSMVYALYLHYNYIITGIIVITPLLLLELLTSIENELSIYSKYQTLIDNVISWTNSGPIIPYLNSKNIPYAWIVMTELFGLAMSNNYICITNVPYSLTMIAYRPLGLYEDWSIKNSMNDYMMLLYIILITEALFHSQ